MLKFREKIQSITYIRYLLIITTLISFILPAFILFYLQPKFKESVEKRITIDAERVSSYLFLEMIKEGYNPSFPKLIPTNVSEKLNEAIKTFKLLEVKFYTPDGLIVYCNEEDEIGKYNKESYFYDKLAKGENFAELVKKDELSLEGKSFQTNLVEAYTSIMNEKSFYGAFEIYYNVSEEINELESLFLSTSILITLVTIIFLGFIIYLYFKSKKYYESRERASIEIRRLKEQQDADYYLTSILTNPLSFNRNDSLTIKADYHMKQKKNFSFMDKTYDIGGDYCAIDKIQLGEADQLKNYIFAINADAMGKSLQGTSGVLVMGVLIESLLAREKRRKSKNITPKEWLSQLHKDASDLFDSFNNAMLISCIAALIEEDTGKFFWFNAEHPLIAVVRNGKAFYIEKECLMSKIGLTMDEDLVIQEFDLQVGDKVYFGSDGRDDLIILNEQGKFEPILEKNTFLNLIENIQSDSKKTLNQLSNNSVFRDDISLIHIEYDTFSKR